MYLPLYLPWEVCTFLFENKEHVEYALVKKQLREAQGEGVKENK